MPSKTAGFSKQLRGDLTTAERMVFALDEIAKHLQMLTLSNLAEPERENALEVDRARLNNWENEGGKVATDVGLPHGIQRLQYDIFVVGPYRYTSLADAIAQLGRTNRHSLG